LYPVAATGLPNTWNDRVPPAGVTGPVPIGLPVPTRLTTSALLDGDGRRGVVAAQGGDPGAALDERPAGDGGRPAERLAAPAGERQGLAGGRHRPVDEQVAAAGRGAPGLVGRQGQRVC
jgi:hypothetical protein